MSSMILGRRLRALRVNAGLKSVDVASLLRCSPGRISQIEGGYRPVSPPELHYLVMEVYRGTREEEKVRAEYELMESYRDRSESGERGWWMESDLGLSSSLTTYIELEHEAEHIQYVGVDVIPGIMQTEEYARYQHQLANTSTDLIEARVQARMHRKHRLYDQDRPLKYDAVITEGTLYRCIKSGYKDQVDHLLDYEQLGNVTVRILTCDAGIHSVANMYSILTLPGEIIPPIVYLQHAAGGLFIEDQLSVRAVTDQYYSAWHQALRSQESFDLIRSITEKREYGRA